LESVLCALDLKIAGIEPISTPAITAPPTGTTGQRQARPLHRGRKRIKRSIGSEQQLRFRYEQNPITSASIATAIASATVHGSCGAGIRITPAADQSA